MHDGHEPVAREEGRKLFVGDALLRKAAQQVRGNQHESDARIGQTLVDGTHHRYAEAKVLLAEPNFDIGRHERFVQFLGRPLPVVPRVAQEAITEVRLLYR